MPEGLGCDTCLRVEGGEEGWPGLFLEGSHIEARAGKGGLMLSTFLKQSSPLPVSHIGILYGICRQNGFQDGFCFQILKKRCWQFLPELAS